jgi:hypothetical protein
LSYTSPASAGTPDTDPTHWTVWQGATLSQVNSLLATEALYRAQAGFAEEQREFLAPRPQIRPNQTFIKAIMSGTVNIVICGDSISEGADSWYVNSWAQNFEQMLRVQIPWITWKVTNLSISGRSIGNLADPAYVSPGSFNYAACTGGITSQAWPDGTYTSGKAWRDYVQDYTPDLIIMAHQENSGDTGDAYQTSLLSFIAYTQTWTKKPWFTFVSMHLPTAYNNPTYGMAFANAQQQRQSLSDINRHLAIYNGYGLIDNNSIMRMMRDGVRREHAPFVVETAFRYWGNSAKWGLLAGGTMPTLSAGVLTFSASASYVCRLDVTARDVDISANFNPPSGGVDRISYRVQNVTDNLSGYSVQYDRTTGVINLYYLANGVAAYTVPSPPGLGTPHNLRVKATGPWHEIFFNGKRVLSAVHGTLNYAGAILIGYPSGSSGGTISTPYICYAPEDVEAQQFTNEQYLLGNYPADYSTNPDSLGGDGIHHLSIKGVFLLMLPACQRFINDLKRFFERPQVLGTAVGTSITNTSGAMVTLGQAITITLSQTQNVKVDVTFGYQNTATSDGVLAVMLDGVNTQSWWLAPTTANNPGNNPRPLTVSTIMQLGAGTHTIDLGWQGTNLSSGGGGGTRYLTVAVQPS